MKVVIQQLLKRFAPKGHDQVTALDNINLSIRQGEFLCILGPSGCGKTTLLNIVAGLEQADSGRVLVDNELVKGAGADRVVVFQEDALFPWLSVIKNVEFGLKMLGFSSTQRRKIAEEYLELVELQDFAQASPHQLSGGMKQRVAIARALAMNPKLLLMDEPFAALDAQTRAMLHKDLQDIWRRTEKTILFVTHNVAEAVCLADRIILMSPRPGRIKKEIKIKLPRPRSENDVMLQRYKEEILEAMGEGSCYARIPVEEQVIPLEMKKLVSTLE